MPGRGSATCRAVRPKKGGAGILVGMWMLESTEFLHVPWEATPHVTRERVAIHRHRANVSGRN